MSNSYVVASYGGASAATEQATVSHDVNPGDGVALCIGTGSAGVTVSSVTDSQGNTWTAQISDLTQLGAYIYVPTITTKLANGVDWIKVIFSGAGTANQWMAQGMAGVASSGAIDVSISTHNASTKSPSIMSGNLRAAQEWVVYFLASGNSGGAPTNWLGNGQAVTMTNNGVLVETSTDGPLTVQQSVQNGSGSFYTLADQVTWNSNPIAASASLSTAAKTAMLAVSFTFAGAFHMGDANVAAGTSTLAVPITVGSRPGNGVVLTTVAGSPDATAVTDSTGGNTWSKIQNDTVEGFHMSAWTPTGNGRVGSTVFPGAYGVSTDLQAAADCNSFVGRPIAFMTQKRYLNETEWAGSGDDKSIPADMTGGVQKIILCIKPLRKNQTTYSGSDYTAELTNLTNCLTWFKSVIPTGMQGAIVLWQECSLSGKIGSFGDGTDLGKKSPPAVPASGVTVNPPFTSVTYVTWTDGNVTNVKVNGTTVGSGAGSYQVPLGGTITITYPSGGKPSGWTWQNSPYAVGNPGSLQESDAATNYANYVNAYAATIAASGLPLYYDPAISSYGPSVDYWNAISSGNQALHSAIVVDYYCSDFDDNQSGKPAAIDSAMASLEAAADALHIPFGIIEWGFNDGQFVPSVSDFVTWAQSRIIPLFQRRLAAGKPCADLIWYMSGGGPNTLDGSTDPAVIAIHQQVYDLFNEAPCAIQTGGTATVTYASTTTVKQAFVVGANINPLSDPVPDKNTQANSGGSTAPSISSGTLAAPNEAVFAFCANSNAGGAPTWSGGFTSMGADSQAGSLFLSAAYQVTSGTGSVTATATLSSSVQSQMFLISFPIAATSSFGMTLPAMSMAFTGTVSGGSGGGDVTGTFNLTLPAMKQSFAGLGSTGTPYVIGTKNIGTGNLSLNIPVVTSSTSGDTIQVGVNPPAPLVVPVVGPDTAGNTYSLVGNDTNGTLYVFESDGTSPLTQGVDSIPVSVGTAVASWGAVAIGDNGVTGPDKVVFANGSSTTPTSPSTGTLSQKEEHAIAWAVTNGVGTVTWTAPWISLANFSANGLIDVSYQVVNATTALTASATDTTSSPWAAGVITTLVTPNTISLTPSNGFQGLTYSQTLEDVGGAGTKTWSITSGSLPPGLTLSAGVISGTPTSAGAYPFTLKVTDAQGASVSAALTITINPAVPAGPPSMLLPTNLLSAGDSTFEFVQNTPPSVTWDATVNANAPQPVSTFAFVGGGCLSWRSRSDGPTAITPSPLPVQPGMPYIASAAIFACAANDCQIGMIWYTVTYDPQTGNPVYTPIGTSYGPDYVATGTQWMCLSAAVTSPANAAAGAPIVLVQESNAGDVNLIDLAFVTQDDTQVLIDWVNGPFSMGGSAGSNFMDVSPWVRMDGNGVSYFRGRQDAISEIQAASGSFDLLNDLGQFARESTISLAAAQGGAITLARRTQINFADEKGGWWTRFDGFLSEIDYSFDDTGNTSVASILLTDVLDHLNRQDALFCWTKSQALFDNPAWHWSLDDPGTAGGAGIAAETSGNNGPAMRLLNSDAVGGASAATIAWQDTSGGVETLADAASATGADSSIYWVAGSNQPIATSRGLYAGSVGPFTTPIASPAFVPHGLAITPWPTGSATAQNTFISTTGYYLYTELPAPIAPTSLGANYTIECYFMPDPSIASNLGKNYGPFICLGLGSSSTKTNMLAGIFLNSGTANFEVATYNQPPSFLGLNWPGATTPTAIQTLSTSWTPDQVKRPHHLMIQFLGDPTAPFVFVYLDGQQVGGSINLPKGQTYDTVTIGSAYGGCGAWFGNVSLVSVYPYLFSLQQNAQHCQLGQYGMWEQTTDDCISLLAQYAGVPGFWSNLNASHTGLTLTDYFDITNANAVSAMQQYEQAEDGLLFVNAAGALTFRARSWRMGYRAPDILLPKGCFDSGLQYNLISQFQCNEEGISGPNTLGAGATTLLANPSTGQTQTQTTTSTVIQAGYVNQASQNQYGVYATYPVSSPLSLPLITWSRAYAALGLPSFTYWTDPNLTDRAAWDANSRSEPWVLPATLVIDLLTFETPTGASPPTAVGKSSFFGLEIGNMAAPSPGTLPLSFPNAQTSVEWFIEGIAETKTIDSHTIQFYTSPAEAQRGWIPGDATYGVLNQTTRLGISSTDLSVTQADGKDVSHDAGPPYWPPSFTTSMNDTTGMGKGFVGAADIRGIAQNLQNLLQPPMCMVSATSQTQSLTNGALTGTSPPNIATLYFDVLHVDTAGGMGAVPGWPNWYLVTQAGFYDIDACITWSVTAGQLGYTGQGWIVVAQDAAQALAAGTGNPLTVNQYVCPVGEAVSMNSDSLTPICSPTTRMYLGVGDMVGIAAEHNYTSARGTSTAGAGSSLSIVYAGLAKVDDKTLINTSLGSTGTVSLVSHGTLQQSVFQNTHTYSYQGNKGFKPNGRRNSDLLCYQGYIGAKDLGSQNAQIEFNYAAIQAALTGHTILSATLTASNATTNYSTGARLMLGTTNITPGGSSWNIGGTWTTIDVMHQSFQSGATKTFNIPVSIVQAFVTGGAKALAMGDGQTTDLNYAGQWQGGPNTWTLTVNYV